MIPGESLRVGYFFSVPLGGVYSIEMATPLIKERANKILECSLTFDITKNDKTIYHRDIKNFEPSGSYAAGNQAYYVAKDVSISLPSGDDFFLQVMDKKCPEVSSRGGLMSLSLDENPEQAVWSNLFIKVFGYILLVCGAIGVIDNCFFSRSKVRDD